MRAAARGSIARVQAETGEREGALATIAKAATAATSAGDEGAALATALREAGRNKSNLSRALKTLPCYGLVELKGEVVARWCHGSPMFRSGWTCRWLPVLDIHLAHSHALLVLSHRGVRV